MSVKLEWNQKGLWDGCIMAGIAHAIMVGKYPLIANEQSWDGKNYSIQDSSGKRGTISFKDEYCVATFRNDNSARIREHLDINQFFEGADELIIELAKEETLQYMLEEIDGKIQPIITTAFWGRGNLKTNDSVEEMMQNGGDLLKTQICDKFVAIQQWKDNYQMSDNQVRMMVLLYEKKTKNPDKCINLSKQEVDYFEIESKEGLIECRESFAEMNIFLD